MTSQNSIGERIQNLRIKKCMSVEELAKTTDIAPSVLEGIEAGKISPPLGNIIMLANAFLVPVGEIFGDSADSPFCIVRSDEQKTISRFGSSETTSGGYSYKSLGYQKQNRQMEPFLVTLSPTEGLKLEPNMHAGEEILYVLEGQVEVSLGDHKDLLNPGDSIYYDSTLPHLVRCSGRNPARILAVIYAKKEMMIF